MIDPINELFDDNKIVNKVKKKLPYLFQIAEVENSRDGKVGMEVGSLREKIIAALLIYKFGKDNVETEIPITESQIDVKVLGIPLSIKTFTGKSIESVKLIWTVDSQKAREFYESYFPVSGLLIVHINWYGKGGFYYISCEVQRRVFNLIGREKYIKLPKIGTNPRGIEISKEALKKLIEDQNTKSIEINWERTEIKIDPYKRWIDLWKED